VGINVGTYVQSKTQLKDGKAERGSPATLANTAVNIAHVGGRIEAFANATVAVTRDDIREFQVKLRALGRFAGPADGVFGEDLRASILRYQREHGLVETGLPTADLAQRLSGFPPTPERRPAARTTGG
jgi:peptidoglycan hydrolase-like protein with peptidoglycan-binding domain